MQVELLTLRLSIAAVFSRDGNSNGRSLLTTSAVSIAPLVGTIASSFLGGVLSGAWIEGVLAFAVAASLYLVTEELPTEAHETEGRLAAWRLSCSRFWRFC
ncbi:hypothetical protein ASC93_00830 [Massilia sp. Root335]|nr:hypothetical protein ASC93_00830 [Massilia sp. Root335]